MKESLGAVSLRREMVAYETLWGNLRATTKRIAEMFRLHQVLPSELLSMVMEADLFDPLSGLLNEVEGFVEALSGFTVSLHRTFQYPERLRDARHPVELFYYRGDIGLTESRCVSVVGARECSQYGALLAADVANRLAKESFTVVSGLARGIDTAAMRSAVEGGGRVIGVVGTPINVCYPRENATLQETVAVDHLLMSQVPFYRYEHESFKARRIHFPERNETMAALSEATVIVEASDRSGTLTQARACIQQGRKLVIMDPCFEVSGVTWPAKYLEKGALRAGDPEAVVRAVGA